MWAHKRWCKRVCQSTGPWVCCVCLCVWYYIRVSVKNHIMCQTSVNLTPCCIKHSRSMLSLSKEAHQMWHDHPISQKEQWTVGGGGWRWQGSAGGGGIGQNLKNGGGRQYKGGLHKIGVLALFCQLCKEILKISYPPIIKPTTPLLAPPISSKNFPPPTLQPFLENLILPTMKGGGFRLYYYSLVWAKNFNSTKRLFILQKKALRLVFLKKRCHTNPLFKDYNILQFMIRLHLRTPFWYINPLNINFPNYLIAGFDFPQIFIPTTEGGPIWAALMYVLTELNYMEEILFVLVQFSLENYLQNLHRNILLHASQGFPNTMFSCGGGTVPPQWGGTVNKLWGGTEKGDKKFVGGL